MLKNNKEYYISCIKVDGVPILPPLITPQLRKELISYKHQAVKLEQRLKNYRELKKNLNDILQAANNTSRSCSQMTFIDNSHIEALNISDKAKTEKDINLTLDNVEVSLYNDKDVKAICLNQQGIQCKDTLNRQGNCDNSNLNQQYNGSIDNSNIKDNISSSEKSFVTGNYTPELSTPTKPRLIRSNSYTLENPSPILLAHLQKTSSNKVGETINLKSARNWTSLEDNRTTPELSDFESVNSVYYNDTYHETKNTNDTKSKTDVVNLLCDKNIGETKSPTIEVYQTDISVQQITVNTSVNAENSISKEDKRELFFNKDPFESFEPDSELLQILKNIPEAAANQIIELLKKQHTEQKGRLERYDNFNNSPKNIPLVSGGACVKSPTNCPSENHTDSSSKSDRLSSIQSNTRSTTEKLKRSSTFSISPSQSLYYSINSDKETVTARSTPSVKLIDLENEEQENVEIGVLRDKNGYWEGVMIHENRDSSCSKELFPKIDPNTLKIIKREWAASVINAHVRGYLTRRLLKTDKVQSLIATVKDVLVCALELHHSDNIDEKDVELHRRLINQLSAALYSFHDIFFELSIPERMSIIAADRQRQNEKLKRSVSGGNSARSSLSISVQSSRSDKSLSQSLSKHKLINDSSSLTKV